MTDDAPSAPEQENTDPKSDPKRTVRNKDEEMFLTSGVHIGTQQKSKDMVPYIFKVRNDGLYVLDVKKSVDRVRTAASMLARYDPDDILMVSTRQYGQRPVELAAKMMGARCFAGRFVPGTLTNPRLPLYIEPKIIVLTDPLTDVQAMKEAVSVGITVVSLCDANNETRFVDLVVPANNKGRRSLATVYWHLTKDYMVASGKIEKEEEFQLSVEDFEARI